MILKKDNYFLFELEMTFILLITENLDSFEEVNDKFFLEGLSLDVLFEDLKEIYNSILNYFIAEFKGDKILNLFKNSKIIKNYIDNDYIPNNKSMLFIYLFKIKSFLLQKEMLKISEKINKYYDTDILLSNKDARKTLLEEKEILERYAQSYHNELKRSSLLQKR